MKKLSFLTLLAFISCIFQGQPQITKGSFMLGGSMIFSSYDTKTEVGDNKQTLFSVSPVFGKVIKDNLIAGGGLSYTRTLYQRENKQIYNGYSASLFIRKYLPLGKRFYFFAEGSVSGTYGKSHNRPASTFENYKRTTVGLNVTPGFAYALSKKWHLETGLNQILGLSYMYEKGSGDGTTANLPYTTKSVNIITGLTNTSVYSLYLGVKYFFGKS